MLTPEDLLEAWEGQAGLLSRCILYGLVEPDVVITPDVHLALSTALVADLKMTKKETPSQLINRMEKAFNWCVRKDVTAEMGIFTGISALALLNKKQRAEIKQTSSYNIFEEKFSKVLSAL